MAVRYERLLGKGLNDLVMGLVEGFLPLLRLLSYVHDFPLMH